MCNICMMVMVEPTSGCDQCHCYCKACYVAWLAEHSTCPACRGSTDKMVRNRPLEDFIAEARVHCRNWGGADEPAAKRFKPATPFAADEQGGLGLEIRGCRWIGATSEFWGHLLKSCGWEPVECARHGCGERMLRKDAAEHDVSSCAVRPVSCTHCNESQAYGQMAAHEGSCPRARVPCPNERCGVLLERKGLCDHRAGCVHETVECPCPGCEVKLLRAEMEAHVDASMGEHNLPAMMREFSRKDREIAELNGQNANLRVQVADLQKRVSGKIIRKVFTWSANGWALDADTNSECLQFRGGVTARCCLDKSRTVSGEEQRTHHLGLQFQKIQFRVGVHAVFRILDLNDEPIRSLNLGSARSPFEGFTARATKGIYFMPTDEEKARALREDGSIKLRAVVDVYLL